MQIKTFSLGPFQTNCYVLTYGGCTWVIDPGQDPEPLLGYLEAEAITPERVLLTHGHADHIAGLPALRERFPELPIAIHADEASYPSDPAENLSLGFGIPLVAPDPTERLEDGQVLDLSGIAVELRHTPGHSPGGLTFYIPTEGLAIVGDTLFAGSIGRTDFPHSEHEALMRSIEERLLTLPNDTTILPGHGPGSTIGRERVGNPFVLQMMTGDGG
ncbi:MAG: MBL fold metallo-hydrolase [Planctomycetota bacterium]